MVLTAPTASTWGHSSQKATNVAYITNMLLLRCAVRKNNGVANANNKANHRARPEGRPRSHRSWKNSTTNRADRGAIRKTEVTNVAAPKRRASPRSVTLLKNCRESGYSER